MSKDLYNYVLYYLISICYNFTVSVHKTTVLCSCVYETDKTEFTRERERERERSMTGLTIDINDKNLVEPKH